MWRLLACATPEPVLPLTAPSAVYVPPAPPPAPEPAPPVAPPSQVVSYQGVALIDAGGYRLDTHRLAAAFPNPVGCTPPGADRSERPDDEGYGACIGGDAHISMRNVKDRPPVGHIEAELAKGLITEVHFLLGNDSHTPCEPVLSALKAAWGEPAVDTSGEKLTFGSNEDTLVHVYHRWETPEQTMMLDCQHYEGGGGDGWFDPGAAEIELKLKP